MFALETRMVEEEDFRIKEFNHLRETIKKLIFSIEQNTLNSKDKQSGNQMFPPPMNQDLTSSMNGLDLLFMKRLMHLKESVDEVEQFEKPPMADLT